MRHLGYLRVRLLAVTLIAAAPPLAIAFFSAYQDRNQEYQRALDDGQAIAKSLASIQARLTESVRAFLDVLSRLPELRALDKNQCGRLLTEIVSRQPRYAYIGTIRADGSVVCGSIPDANSVNVTDRSWFRKAMATRDFAIGDYQVGRISGKPSLGFAKPLIEPYGRISGVLYAAIDLQWLDNQVFTANFPPHAVLAMFDAQGTLIARYPKEPGWVGKSFADHELYRTILGAPSKATVEATSLDGAKRLFHVEKMFSAYGAPELLFAFGIPTEAIGQQIRHDLFWRIGGIALFTIFLFSVAYLASDRLILKPMHRLIVLSNRISRGDFAARSGLSHGDGEFSRLAESLDSMAATLEAHHAELEERNELLNESQETAHIGAWEWRVGESMFRCTPELCRIFRRDPVATDMPVEEFMALIHPGDRQICLDWSRKVAEGLPSAEFEFRLQFPSGEIRYCWSVVRRIRDATDGNPALIRGTTQDITERRRTEKEKERGQAMIDAVLNMAVDAIIGTDGIGRITSFNIGAERTFGYSGIEVIGKPIEVLIPERLRARHANLVNDFAAGPTRSKKMAERRMILGLRKDGTEFQAEASIAKLNLDGTPVLVVVLRDVTEQRQMMASLHQAQKMEAVGQLTGGIAHDFNNLLAVVIGNLDLVLPKLQSPDDKELVQEALTGALRGAELTSRLLAFARRQTLESASVDIRKLLLQMSKLFKRALGEAIVINVSAGDDLWPCIADPNQLENALLNLAINARDAMPMGGTLTVEAKNAYLDSEYAEHNADVTPGDYVKISVTDTGTGMPPDVLSRVLEPFYTTKEPGKGTGLGLSMVYGLAKQLGGHLKIYSELGHGTTVNLYLPRAMPEDEAKNRQDQEAMDVKRGSETILVVDDNDMVRRTAVRQLAGLGYDVVEATNPDEALAILKTGRPINLLFSDVVMPGGKTGFDLAKEAHRLYPDLKILLVTGFAEAAAKKRNELGDTVEMMTKPYRGAELAARVRNLLDRQ